MGSPVSLVDLAEKMIRLRGLRTPADIPIVFTRLRPGERLHERLFFPQERAAPTDHPRVLRVAAGVETPALASLRTVVQQLRERMTPQNVNLLISLLRQVVAGPHDASTKPSDSAESTVIFEPATVQ
jgi:FlaA1/EpsC-like NDP-sugar epimerase